MADREQHKDMGCATGLGVNWPHRPLISQTCEASACLNEDGEVNDDNGGGEEELAVGKQVLVEQHDQREGDGAAQASVRHDEDVVHLQLDEAEAVDEEAEDDDD